MASLRLASIAEVRSQREINQFAHAVLVPVSGSQERLSRLLFGRGVASPVSTMAHVTFCRVRPPLDAWAGKGRPRLRWAGGLSFLFLKFPPPPANSDPAPPPH